MNEQNVHIPLNFAIVFAEKLGYVVIMTASFLCAALSQVCALLWKTDYGSL